jgi:hypothetical protein
MKLTNCQIFLIIIGLYLMYHLHKNKAFAKDEKALVADIKEDTESVTGFIDNQYKEYKKLI